MSADDLAILATTRREFCAGACKVASLVVAGLVVPACGGSPTSPSSSGNAPTLSSVSASVSGRTVAITVGTESPLAGVGGAATVSTSLGRFLLARTGQDTVTALTAVCTHEACDITGFASQRFVCPCHGSQFTTSGAVANGPATTALRSYATTFSNGEIRFDV